MFDGLFLDEALLHEIGHVFGFQHHHAGIMMADNLERTMTVEAVDALKSMDIDLKSWQIRALNGLFEPDESASQVVKDTTFITAFGAKSEKALIVSREQMSDTDRGSIAVFKAIPNKNNVTFNKGEKIGALTVDLEEKSSVPILEVKIPENQAVFQWQLPGFNQIKNLGSVKSTVILWEGVYSSLDGRISFPMQVKTRTSPQRLFPGDELEITIVLDNKIKVLPGIKIP